MKRSFPTNVVCDAPLQRVVRPDREQIRTHEAVTRTSGVTHRFEFVLRTLEYEYVTFDTMPFKLTYKCTKLVQRTVNNQVIRERTAFNAETNRNVGFPLVFSDLVLSYAAYLNGTCLSTVTRQACVQDTINLYLSTPAEYAARNGTNPERETVYR